MLSEFFISSGYTIVSMVFTLLVLVMFILKREKKGTKSTKKSIIYLILVIVTLISMMLHVVLCYCATITHQYTNFISKITLFFIIEWEYIIMLYVTTIYATEEELEKALKEKKLMIIILGIVLTIINISVSILLPVNFTQSLPQTPFVYSGPLYNYFDISGILVFVVLAITMIRNRKKVDTLTLILINLMVVLFVSAYLLTYLGNMIINTDALLQSIFIIILYFSIESQDSNLLIEYNNSIKKAEETNKVRSEFIMNMSHQLRTPMNTVLGFSKSILENENESLDEIKEETKNINMASKQLMDLLNSILKYSELESNKISIEENEYELNNVISDIKNEINQNNKENVNFSVNVNELCPQKLFGDNLKIKNALSGIVSNIIEKTNYGEVILNVDVAKKYNDYIDLQISIKSTAGNIDIGNVQNTSDELSSLTENNNIDVKTMNLVISKKLLEILNGNVELKNNPGQGTECIITIKQKIIGENINTLSNEMNKVEENNLLEEKINGDKEE